MNTITVLKEMNPISNSSKSIDHFKDKRNSNPKNIFAIKCENPVKPKEKINYRIKKENSMSIPKQIDMKPKKMKIENLLDFDKILSILNETKEKPENPPQFCSEHKNRKKSFLHKKKNRSKNSIGLSKNSNVIKKKKFHRNHCSTFNCNSNDIYNIDNFCSSTVKIIEKKNITQIKCPSFREIPENEINLLDDLNNQEIINENTYLPYHNLHEKREIEYRQKLFSDSFKRKNPRKRRNLLFGKPDNITEGNKENNEICEVNNETNATNETNEIVDRKNLIIKINLD